MTAMTRTRARHRPGFTLVELMVAAAVCVIIMAVLATVFQSGIDTIRDMRSVGSLQDQLRAATEMIRRDLQADHFVPRDPEPDGTLISGAKLSDQRLTDSRWDQRLPLGGFFHIESDKTGVIEKPDSDFLTFAQSANANSLLHFTSILAGDKPQNMYSANLGSTGISSPAAEIVYFVDVNTNPTSHRLIRRQRLVARSEAERNKLLGGQPLDPQVVAGAGSTVFTLEEIARTANRINPSRTLLGNSGGTDRTGDDVLLSNVKMFEVKVSWDTATGVPGSRPFNDTSSSPPPTDFPFDFLNGPGGPNTVFDTGDGQSAATAQPGGATATSRIRVKALQIRLRIYDPQMKTTRQVTIVQDL